MKHQRGYIWRTGKSWYARWYREELEADANGVRRVVRRQHAEKLAEYGDRYRFARDLQPLLDEKLRPLNEGRSSPESTLSVAGYAESFFLPWAERELKPSTANGYKGLWRTYLRPHLADKSLRDFRCVDATKMLAAIHREHSLSRKSLRHCKALLSTILAHAKRAGIVDGLNAAMDAGIPRAAKSSEPTHAYTLQEVLAMLDVLSGVARAAVGVMFFCGLRPSEARAVRWEDLDLAKRTLSVHASMWRTHFTSCKTEVSAAVVPVAEILSEILSETPRISEFILSGPTGRPIDLHNLASRVVRPALRAKGLAWFGWYGFRRGLATLATSVETPLAAKGLLRHSNVSTTMAHYVKDIPGEAARAIAKINALLDRGGNAAVAPN